MEEKSPSQCFICPITMEEMSEPVLVVETGQTVDRHALEEWLVDHNTCPVTGVDLKSTKYTINFALKSAIEAWKTEVEPLEEEWSMREAQLASLVEPLHAAIAEKDQKIAALANTISSLLESLGSVAKKCQMEHEAYQEVLQGTLQDQTLMAPQTPPEVEAGPSAPLPPPPPPPLPTPPPPPPPVTPASRPVPPGPPPIHIPAPAPLASLAESSQGTSGHGHTMSNVSMSSVGSFYQQGSYRDEADQKKLDLKLLKASKAGNVIKVEKYIREGANVDTRDSHGWTPLYFAVHYVDGKVVKALLDAGCSVNLANNIGETPLGRAIRMRKTYIIELLERAGGIT